jgi:magnesium transporter
LQVLFQGLKASAVQIITIVMAFITICIGITILQMSKVDPTTLKTLDRRSTILLQAARQNTEAADEKSAAGFEDPGIDALRGSFGAFGSIIRANTAKRMSKSSRGNSSLRNRTSAGIQPYDVEADPPTNNDGKLLGMTRHQLYDAPVPRDPNNMERVSSFASSDRRPTIKFDSQDVVHQYHPTGKGDTATHEHRNALHGYPYPPTPNSAALGSPRGADISEINLVDVEALQETVTVSPRTTAATRTAPPTLNPLFFQQGESANASASHSASDSIESGSIPWEDEEGKARHSHRQGRSYPRGEDDKDESMSLWLEERPSLEGEEGASRNAGGIRLVKPSSDTRF